MKIFFEIVFIILDISNIGVYKILFIFFLINYILYKNIKKFALLL